MVTGAATLALALVAVAALAQPAAAQYRTNWEGVHVGGTFGWFGGDYDIRQRTPASPLVATDGDADGGMGGVVYGTTWQFDGWVFGTDSDYTWSDAETGPNVVASGLTATVDTKWTSSTRVRAGHLVSPNLLVYGTLGIAWSRLEASGPLIAAGGRSRTTTGFQYGGGVEYTTDSRWFARVEYLHTDYSDKSFAEVGGGRLVADLDSDVVRGALGYRFDWSWFDLLR